MKFSFSLLVFVGIWQLAIAQNNSITGFFKQNVDSQLKLESQFDKNLSTESIDKNIKQFSAVPHHLGSKGSKDNAEFILNSLNRGAGMHKLKLFMCYSQLQKKEYLK